MLLRRILLLLCWCVAGAVVAPAGAVSAAENGDPVAELVERHAPVLVMRDQPVECGEGEPYSPMPVDALFGREGVVLRGPGGARIEAPTAADLAAAEGGDWYLDLPGNALRPGCTYERLYRAMVTSGAAPVTAYARVTTDAERPGVLVLQYWLFSLYNDWNDRHEGDWEMIQLHFEAEDASGALRTTPSLVAYAQHEGAEISDWDGGPLEIVDGQRPLVYVAEGSHASYFSSERWFGKSAQSGFGCDDTTGPSMRVRPEVVLLDAGAPPSWLAFEGHWGERRPSFNNGPTGPITKEQWDAPVRWVEDGGRRGAVALPANGSTVTDLFCEATSVVSQVLFGLLDRPVVVGGVVLVVLAGAVTLARLTRWGPVSITPVGQRRRSGQIVRTALRIVVTRPRQFARIGSIMVVAGVLASAVQALVIGGTEAGDIADVLDRDSASGGLLALALGLVVVIPATALVSVATVDAVMRLDGPRPRLRDSLRRGSRDGRVIALQLLLGLILAASFFSVVLAPVGIWLVARWAVAVPAAALGERPLRRSSALTRGSRVRCAVLVGLNALFVSIVPASIGVLVLVVTDAGFALVNAVAAVVAMFTVPAASVAATLLYLDLDERSRVDVHGSPGDGPTGVVEEAAVV